MMGLAACIASHRVSGVAEPPDSVQVTLAPVWVEETTWYTAIPLNPLPTCAVTCANPEGTVNVGPFPSPISVSSMSLGFEVVMLQDFELVASFGRAPLASHGDPVLAPLTPKMIASNCDSLGLLVIVDRL